MRSVVRRVGWTLGYCLFLLVLLEVGSRVFFRALPRFWGRIPGLQADSCWRIRWVQRHRGVAPNPYDAVDVYHPTRGWALKPGLRDVPVFGDTTVSSNARGLRGITDHAVERPPDQRRIAALGDSFVFGWEVNDDETMSAVLGTLLEKTEVVNLGVHGYGHDQMLLYLQEEGLRYHPNVVLLGFVDVDVERNILSFRDYAKPRFVLEGGRLRLTNVPIPAQDMILAAEPYQSKLWDVGSILYSEIAWDLGPLRRRAEAVTSALLDEIRRTTEQGGAELVIVYLPLLPEIEAPLGEPTLGERYLSGYCREAGLRCPSLRPRLHEELGGHVEPRPGDHWNAREHRIAAQALAEYFAAQKNVGLAAP